jgi:integrase
MPSYARVSTDGQSVDAQVKQLRAAGAAKVYRETASGAKTERAQLRRVLAQLDVGDVLMVTRLDRLARSTRDLLNTLDSIAGKRAGFRSLGDVWADTTTPHGRLMLIVLGGLAEFERELIRARMHEGRARANADRRRSRRAGPKSAGDKSEPPRNGAAPERGPLSFRSLLPLVRTPVLSPDEARRLLDSIDPTTHVELRDRALIGLMVCARGGAWLNDRSQQTFLPWKRHPPLEGGPWAGHWLAGRFAPV